MKEFNLFCPEIKKECIGSDCAFYIQSEKFDECACAKAEVYLQLADMARTDSDCPGVLELLKRAIRKRYR